MKYVYMKFQDFHNNRTFFLILSNDAKNKQLLPPLTAIFIIYSCFKYHLTLVIAHHAF